MRQQTGYVVVGVGEVGGVRQGGDAREPAAGTVGRLAETPLRTLRSAADRGARLATDRRRVRLPARRQIRNDICRRI